MRTPKTKMPLTRIPADAMKCIRSWPRLGVFTLSPRSRAMISGRVERHDRTATSSAATAAASSAALIMIATAPTPGIAGKDSGVSLGKQECDNSA